MRVFNSKSGNEIQDERYVAIISKMVEDKVSVKMIDGYLVEVQETLKNGEKIIEITII